MRRVCASLVLMALAVAIPGLTGCGDSKTDDRQPKLQGEPDPRLKGGPAQPGGGGGGKVQAGDAVIQ